VGGRWTREENVHEAEDRDETGGEPVTSYAEALRRLGGEGWCVIEKSLYTETLEEQLERLAGQPEAASSQTVRLVRHPDRVEIFRVHRTGEREYVDETPQAVVRRAPEA